MKSSALIILASLCATSAHAAMDAKMIVGISSLHFNERSHKYLNENNPAIGFEAYDIQSVYVSKNSWNEKSLYLTYTPDYKVNDYLSLSLNLGAASGYKCSNYVNTSDGKYHNDGCSNSGIVPLYAATIEYSPFANNFALSASVNHSIAMFSVSYNFK